MNYFSVDECVHGMCFMCSLQPAIQPAAYLIGHVCTAKLVVGVIFHSNGFAYEMRF